MLDSEKQATIKRVSEVVTNAKNADRFNLEICSTRDEATTIVYRVKEFIFPNDIEEEANNARER